MSKINFRASVGGNATIRFIALTFGLLISFTAAAYEPYSIYLVRHAEKVTSNPEDSDPNLTHCGDQRADRLAVILESIEIDVIYSSDYRRTRETAAPVANNKRLDVQLYDPNMLGQFAEKLQAEKRDTLVVGHSNTTGVLAGMLAGIEIEEFSEAEYDRLYQVIISPDSAKLSLLHQAFECKKGPT
ncbi:MAG: phosphoglycerate mutase family protein [Halioglobus sp.]